MRGRGYSNVVRIRWQGGGKTRFCSNNHRPSHVETRGEGSIHKPGRALTKTQPSWHPDLRLPASTTARKVISLFKPFSAQYFVMRTRVAYYRGSTAM